MRKILFFFALSALLISCDDNEHDNTPILGNMPTNNIKKIVVDKNGQKWVLTDKGVVSLNFGNWFNHPDLEAVNKNTVNDISVGNPTTKDHVLISTTKGAFNLKISNDRIESVQEYSVANGKIISDMVWVSCLGYNNDLYFGTPLGLMSYSDNKCDTFDGYLSDGRTNGEKMLMKYKSTAIALTNKNRGYLCTLGGGVSRFNTSAYNDTIDSSTGATVYTAQWAYIGSDSVFTVLITDDTCQWFGSANGAGYHTSFSTRREWTYFSRSNGDGLICDSVLSIAKDNSGNMWFGTYLGVSKYDGTDWTSYTSATTDGGLVNNKVNSIAVDVDGSLWFGTDGGLSHLTGNTWAKFTTSSK